MCFQASEMKMSVELCKSLSDHHIGWNWAATDSGWDTWILRLLLSWGRSMLPLVNWAVLFEKLKLVFQAAWKSVYLVSHPLLHICLPGRIWKSYYIYLHSSYFSYRNIPLSEIPNKYLFKSMSRWIFCLLIIILCTVGVGHFKFRNKDFSAGGLAMWVQFVGCSSIIFFWK